VTVALLDDQQLGGVVRGQIPRGLRGKQLYTTGCWYVRLCTAVLAAQGRRGALSDPFSELPERHRARALGAVLELPDDIGLLSLRELGPVIAHLRHRHRLNLLAIEALAAATHLGADVHLSAPSPRLERALAHEQITCSLQLST
jgi:hypothetical protein